MDNTPPSSGAELGRQPGKEAGVGLQPPQGLRAAEPKPSSSGRGFPLGPVGPGREPGREAFAGAGGGGQPSPPACPGLVPALAGHRDIPPPRAGPGVNLPSRSAPSLRREREDLRAGCRNSLPPFIKKKKN